MSRIVGNRSLCEKLCHDVLSDKLSHAFILEGARGTGKHTVAISVAAALACSHQNGDGAFPCYECRECKKVLESKCPDVNIIGTGGKATLVVDTVRALREDVRTVPNDLDFKLYIIEDADKMTEQAQNALLLTLEEPPSYVRFILLCENADLLLETIRSRAPILRTESLKTDDIDEYICRTDRRAAQMKLSSPSEYAELILSANHGIGTALEYLDPQKFAPVKETRSLVTRFCDMATSSASAKEALMLLKEFSPKRDVLKIQLKALSEAVTDLLIIKKSDNASLSFFADTELAVEMSDRVSASFLYTLSNAVITAINSTEQNSHVKLTLIKLISDANII